MDKQGSHAYYKTLGAHIAVLRKSRGMTQGELARVIGVSQQAVFAYEVGDRRISLFILSKVAKVFGTSVEELIGIERPVRMPRGKLSPRAQRHAKRIQLLPKAQQRFILRILDQLEEGNKNKK